MSWLKRRKVVLHGSHRETIKNFTDKKDNLLFLDFDGVINTEGKVNKRCMRYLNRFCKRFQCRIVVSSSWKFYFDYKAFLYQSGLKRDIIIEGKTDVLKSRAAEIKKFVKEYPYLGKYIIIDDEVMEGLENHQIQTDSVCGFDLEKYKAAVALFQEMKEDE